MSLFFLAAAALPTRNFSLAAPLRAADLICPPLLPTPQSCSVTSTQTISLLATDPPWRIGVNLSDVDDTFAASYLQANLSAHVNLSIVDARSLINLTHVILIERSCAVQSTRGGSDGVQDGTSAEAYTLQTSTNGARLSGVGAPGAFYAAVTFTQLVRLSSAASIPAVSIADHPELPTRGYEVEMALHPPEGDQFLFFRSVADVLASMKLNWCELLMPPPLHYDYTTGVWTYPNAAWVSRMRALLAYFAARHIEVVLPVSSKWDPRTLEGKAVAHEPFALDSDGVAKGVRPTAMPLQNGDFEQLRPDGRTPIGWSFDRGSTSGEVPCSVDSSHAASGRHSIKCDVQQFPDPKPPSAASTNARDAHVGWQHGVSRGGARRVGANPTLANYSGPLTSDLFEIPAGSLLQMSFKASWKGNWTGDFVAVVSMKQYVTREEATQDENPTFPKWPDTHSFTPCRNGDHGHCGGATAIPTLPSWASYNKNFITMPNARFVRIRAYVAGWGAGQFWLDDFKIRRVDALLLNVVRLPDSDVVATNSAGERLSVGVDYTIDDPADPAARYDPFGNFSRLQPLVVRRVPTSKKLAAGANLSLSYNVLPGSANQMVGSRDVSCYVEKLYYTLLDHAVRWVVANLAPPALVADGFDEQIGMGRDSRTLDSKLSNGQILGKAINSVNAIVKAAPRPDALPHTKLVIWADLVVPDHNGGTNYSWLSGGGRQQPYWPAIEIIDKDILLLSWEYDVSDYTRKLIADDPALFHKYSLPWMGAAWMSLENAQLWRGAMRESRRRFGKQSTAKGLLCTNWGGGRIEAALPSIANMSWNLG